MQSQTPAQILDLLADAPAHADVYEHEGTREITLSYDTEDADAYRILGTVAEVRAEYEALIEAANERHG